jgi:hypothetical protein
MLMQINEVESVLNSAEWVFPFFECIHIAGFAVAIGTIALVDFTLLGAGVRREKAPQLLQDMAPWTLVGLAMVLISGPILFLTDADKYLFDRSFRIKMTCLALAILFNYTFHNTAARLANTRVAKIAAGVSLLLWVLVVGGGIFIAYLGTAGG